MEMPEDELMTEVEAEEIVMAAQVFALKSEDRPRLAMAELLLANRESDNQQIQ